MCGGREGKVGSWVGVMVRGAVWKCVNGEKKKCEFGQKKGMKHID